MRWRLGFLLTLFAGILLVLLLPPLRNKAKDLLSYSACNTPQPYKIGAIDPRFNLSYVDVQEDVQQAIDIWNAAEGKTLFVYSPHAALTVNFVYDERQALNSQIQQLNNNLNQKDASLQQKVNDFKTQQAAFEAKVAAFDELVNTYNSQGGVSPDVYKSLIQQQNDLNSQGQALNSTAKQLNLSTSDYNTGVSNLNQDVHQLNAALSQKPEEGLYDGSNATITIYLTNGNAELIHTLAHEFGHALGMVHVDGATSIIYPYTSSSLTATPNDLVQLTYVCRQQSLILHDALIFDEWLFTQMQNFQQDFLKK